MDVEQLVDIYLSVHRADEYNAAIMGMGESVCGRMMEWKGCLPDRAGAMDSDAKMIRTVDRLQNYHALAEEVKAGFEELRNGRPDAHAAICASHLLANQQRDDGRRYAAADIAKCLGMKSTQYNNQLQFARQYVAVRLAHVMVG